MITKEAPRRVLIVGTSPQMKYPKIIANKRAKYFKGVTKETSEYLYDCPNHKFATPPKMPTKDNKIKSCKLGITHPCGIVKKLNKVIDKEK